MKKKRRKRLDGQYITVSYTILENIFFFSSLFIIIILSASTSKVAPLNGDLSGDRVMGGLRFLKGHQMANCSCKWPTVYPRKLIIN